MRAQPIAAGVAVDLEKFRLRNFVRELTKIGEIGFDLTRPVGEPDKIENRRAFARRIGVAPPRHQTVRQALEGGPMYFAQIMDAVGSRDGREVALALDELREQGILARLDDGEWTLKQEPTT